MDPGAHSRDRAERCRKIHVGGREVTARRDLPALGPVDPPLAADGAVHQRNNPLRQAGKLLGLQVGSEGQARHIERRMARPGRKPMLDGDVGHQCAGSRMVERAGRADVIPGEGEVQVVGPQRIEARIRVAVRDHRSRVDCQVLVTIRPAAGAVGELQRDLADRGGRAREASGDVATDHPAGEAASIEEARRGRPSQPHAKPVEPNCWPL